MARVYGSKNRRSVPNATEMVKYSAQTLQKGLEYLSEVIESDWNDSRFTHKHRLDCIKAQADLLNMAGYGKELEAGSRQLHNLKGETNPYREEKDITPIKPQIEPDAQTDEKPKEKEGLISRFVESQSIQ